MVRISRTSQLRGHRVIVSYRFLATKKKLPFIMYRFGRRLCQTYVSSSSSQSSYSNRHVSPLASNCRRLLKITSNYPSAGNLIRTLYFFNTLFRETDNTILDKNEMEGIVSYDQLLDAQKDDSVLIVDVREDSEINETGALPGSIHIPMNDVTNVFENLSEEDFLNKYRKPKPNKDTKMIFSCRSGRRSESVQKAVQKLGYTQAYNYSGGWLDWEKRQGS
ncbi:hypothetical protein PUN28_004208 [Cardiocondyla obscurior]